MAQISSHGSTTDKPRTGNGGRGPHPPKVFGGGGGSGGGRGEPDHFPDYTAQLHRYRVGLIFAVVSVVMLFTSFTVLFMARRSTGRWDASTRTLITDWVPVHLPIQLLLLNTCVLLLSSLTAERARRLAALEAVIIPASNIPGVARIFPHSQRWLEATAVLGVAFVTGQWHAWRLLEQSGALFSNGGPASAFVYLLTGAHAVHLCVGLGAIFYVALIGSNRKSLEWRRITSDVCVWYWHFMALMWLYVLTTLWFLH